MSRSRNPWTYLADRVRALERQVIGPEDRGERAAANVGLLLKLRAAVDAEIDREILRARQQGASWSLLAAVAGMGSKQAAQQRHAAAARRAEAARQHREERASAAQRAEQLREERYGRPRES
jgi:hypothetical protein